MKRTLPIVFLLITVFCPLANTPCVTASPTPKPCVSATPADIGCVTTCCPDGIDNIAECPDEGCTRKTAHEFDPELNKLKNKRSDDGGTDPDLKSIQWIKALSRRPSGYKGCGTRDVLTNLGEGKKITVVAWALTARKEEDESANCDLKGDPDTDNHIVLVDPALNDPTLARDECESVTAEFTPRVRNDDHHQNFTRNALNSLIDSSWAKNSSNNPNGKRLVRVTGLLMFDSGHLYNLLKRATNWEIHPVLKMEYCDEGKTCVAESDENWKDLDDLPSDQVSPTP